MCQILWTLFCWIWFGFAVESYLIWFIGNKLSKCYEGYWGFKSVWDPKTLSDRIKGKNTKIGGGKKTELSKDEEKILAHYCMLTAKCSHPFAVTEIKAFPWAILRKSNQPSRFHPTNGPSWKWWWSFKRRPELSSQKPDNLNRGRSRMNK